MDGTESSSAVEGRTDRETLTVDSDSTETDVDTDMDSLTG
jgi:hypothetical protein